ncbi:MAG: hypothetical protein NTY35_12395 [Planctomycetota bacterium]|nr:hypothetical protein [Planctomycetota bacterium]
MRRISFLNGEAALLLVGSALLAVGLALPSRASLQGTGTGGNNTTPNPNPFTTPIAAIGNADSNSQMIAVTGIDLTGSSILYLVDTQKKQLAIYQATGGTESMQGVKLVGARRIDLDLQLEGFNDRSQYPYEELEQRFAKIRAGASASGK